MNVIEPAKEHWHVFLNPAAGGGLAASCWEKWQPKLVEMIPQHSLHVSTHRKHLTELTTAAILQQQARFLLVVGGDGALHEVVNGICAQAQIPTADIVVALLPVGTGNDWIKTYSIPQKFAEWTSMFQTGYVQQQAIGELRFHVGEETKTAYFVNAAGMAFDAFVVRYANRVRRRWMTNRFFYLWAILRCLFIYRLKPARVHINGEKLENRYYTVSCGIGRYAGGGMQITPHAHPQAPQLAVTIAGQLSPLAVLLNTYRFYNGTIGEHARVSLWHSSRVRVEASGKDEILLEADGEYLGHSPAEIGVSEARLHFIAPSL